MTFHTAHTLHTLGTQTLLADSAPDRIRFAELHFITVHRITVYLRCITINRQTMTQHDIPSITLRCTHRDSTYTRSLGMSEHVLPEMLMVYPCHIS